MKKLSVIIPCYNVEDYVGKCIESVLDNKIKDIEIILVNDGSKDNTLDIIKKYEKEHKEIKVIDQKNGGLSDARNTGLSVATGKYVTFLDSDDYVDSNMYVSMLEKAEENDFDLVCCGVKWLYPTYEVNSSAGFDNDLLTKDEVKSEMYRIYPGACNKIYKRSTIGDLRFKKGVWYEDVEFTYRYLANVNSIGLVPEYYYYYMQREGSITYTYNEKLFDLIDNLNSVVKYYEDNNLMDEYSDEIEYTYVRYLYATFVKRLAKMKDKKRFNEGVKSVIKCVKEKFPNYKKNKYMKMGMKGKYLKHFNMFIANIVYFVEKNKMN